jgi:hypothetical protein
MLLLPWERLLWSQRAAISRKYRCILTDFRVVKASATGPDELALADVADVTCVETWRDRLLGTATVVVRARRGRGSVVLEHIRRGAQLAALIEIAAAAPASPLDPSSVRAIMAREPRTRVAGFREAALSIAAMITVVFTVAIGLHGKTAGVTYPSDDAIAPDGIKKDRASIVRFMEREVMPWAREALAPVAGGRDRVSCQTCHGRSAEDRAWQMPAVSALPLPDVAIRGWERYSSQMDAQMRNAIYGYAAESENHLKARHMREEVMPGMARLLRRPAYDFTRSYEFNRTQAAFGCYHCHQVR